MNEREELRKILIGRSILKGDFTLVSGRKSSYYINGKMTTLHSMGLYLSASLLLGSLSDLEYDAFAGPVIGADPIIGALLTLTAQRGEEKEGFLIRKEAKGHGTQRLVEGKLEKGMRVIVVEDVVTTGGSLLRAAEAVEKEGGEISAVHVLVDREEGAAGRIEGAGYLFRSLFRVSELL
jgi:orotate phosphoribosyltransferase